MSQPYVTSTQVASSLPYDNSITGLGSGDAQSAIDAIANKNNGTTGVTPFFQMGQQGGVGTSSYLRNSSQIPSNQVGQLIPGSNKIVKLTVSVSQSDNQIKSFKLQRRTSVNTFIDISGATISIPGDSSTYSVVVTGLNISIGPDWEIAAQVTSGNAQNPVLSIFVVSQ
jgi:hypothetical protein